MSPAVQQVNAGTTMLHNQTCACSVAAREFAGWSKSPHADEAQAHRAEGGPWSASAT